MNKKQVIKLIAFLLIFTILFTGSSAILRAKWTTGNSEDLVADEFKDVPEDSLELIFMGSSQMTYGVIPPMAYQYYGISSYSIAGGNMPPLIQYYWLLDVFKTQKNIKTLVLDVSMIYEAEGETRYRKSLNSMNWSLNKLKAIWAHSQDPLAEDEMKLYLIDLIRYHSRWNELEKSDFTYWTDDHNFYRGSRMTGYVWHPDIPYEVFITDNDPEESEEAVINELQLEYFEKILDVCKENGIEVILIKTPKENWTKEGSIFVTNYAEENGYPFLDFSTDAGMKTLGIDYYQDLKDADHLNIRGAEKLTRYLCEYVMENTEYTDYREVEGYKFEKYDEYFIDYMEKLARTCTDPYEVLTYFNSDLYEVVIQSTADISSLWTKEQQEQLEATGATLDISEMKGKNYVIHIKEGKCVYEESSDEPIYYEGTLNDEITFKTYSDLAENEYTSKMVVKKNDEVFKAEGMNILIRSADRGKIFARGTIYIDDGELAYFDAEE